MTFQLENFKQNPTTSQQLLTKWGAGRVHVSGRSLSIICRFLWIWFASFWRAAQVLAWNISKLVSSPNRSEQKRSSTATNQMQDRDMVEHILNYNEKQRGVKWEIRLKSSSAIKPRKNKKQMRFFNVTFLQFWFIFSTLFSLLCCNECSLHLRDASDAVRPKCKCCTDLWWKTEGRPNKPKW